MKKILFTLLLLSLPVMIKATGQMAERLSINGEYWQLYYCPIETDMALSEEIPDDEWGTLEKWTH